MEFAVGLVLGALLGCVVTFLLMRGDARRDQLVGVDQRSDLQPPPPPPMPQLGQGDGSPHRDMMDTTHTDALDPVARQEVLNLILTGKKIAAIKLVRERAGQGLAEAKDTVERIERHIDGDV